MPSVLSASSTPSHRLRSQRPATSAAWAWGTLRAWASSSAIVCSAAERMLDCGAFTTITPRRGGGFDVDVVEPDAGPADDDRGRSPASSTSAVTLVAERMIERVGTLDDVEQLVGLTARAARRPRGRPRAGGRARRRRSLR